MGDRERYVDLNTTYLACMAVTCANNAYNRTGIFACELKVVWILNDGHCARFISNFVPPEPPPDLQNESRD